MYPDLTVPVVGSVTARTVRARALARLPGDIRGFPLDALATPGARAAMQSVQAWVGAATGDPHGALAAGLRTVLALPTAGGLVRCLREDARARRRGRGADALATELTAVMALELACAGALPEAVTVEPPPGRVLALAAGWAHTLPPGVTALQVRPDAVGHRRGSVWTYSPLTDRQGVAPWDTIVGAMRLARADNNPLAVYGLSPGDPPNAVNLGGHPVDAWLGTLQRCLDLTGEHLPQVRAEIELGVQLVVPIGHDPETHRSASYRQALGTIYLSLHPGLMTMTEALIHEAQHTKLHALMEVDPVITNDTGARFPSPLRKDPRPLRGVLLAVHAFLPVARLYEAMVASGHPLSARPAFQARYAQVKAVNRDAAAVLMAHATPTAAGALLLQEIAREIEHFG